MLRDQKYQKEIKQTFFLLPQLYICSFNRRGKQIWIYENEIYFIPYSSHIAGIKCKKKKLEWEWKQKLFKWVWRVSQKLHELWLNLYIEKKKKKQKMLQSSLDGFRQRYFMCYSLFSLSRYMQLILFSHQIAFRDSRTSLNMQSA